MRDAVHTVLDRALTDSAFPGAYAAVGTADSVLAEYAVGRIDWAAGAPRPDGRTLWDVASLTKLVGTTSAMVQLVAAGRVDLDAPVQRYLPEWTGRHKQQVQVHRLLSHGSGLPAWRPLYKEATSPGSALALVLATELDTVPGAGTVYSDLNAILLGRLVERVTGQRLDAYLAAHVFGPLGMADTRFNPPASERGRIAPTEYDPWRQRHLRGEVHDENAYALGGVAGHAGLFSTGHDMILFAQEWLRTRVGRVGAEVLPVHTRERFAEGRRSQSAARAFGWEKPTGTNSAGHYMSARAFGHTGFTGTSLWIDPERGVFVLLLSNRVNPTRQNPRLAPVRVALADAVMRALGAAPTAPAPAAASTPPRP